MLIDHGAPQISLAQAEFEEAAKMWQKRAAEATAQAEKYTELARALRLAYEDAIFRSLGQGD